jgi:secreted PhoX family phosphatase
MAPGDGPLDAASLTRAVLDRRQLLKAGALGAALLAADALFPRRATATQRYGPVGPVDANGLQLPSGFTSRVVARSKQLVAGTTYEWHRAPDGGRCFPTSDGWIYVSNAELSSDRGGAAMIRFDDSGAIVDARRILDGTNRNCSGGHTPWGTWLSCEETDDGRVWEADPFGVKPAVVHPGMGRFDHEGAAVDGPAQTVYMTEDAKAGLFYRYRYNDAQDLSTGVLEGARVQDGAVSWVTIPDPSAQTTPTRRQVPDLTKFNGGEGIWLHDGVVNFTTKGDDRIWAYDIAAGRVEVVYDWTTDPDPVLRGVDNIAVRANGDIFVCEDQGAIGSPEDPEICIIEPGGAISVFLRAVGHRESELTGVAFNPAGDRMYFSSQRGTVGKQTDGMTFEVSGPFDPAPRRGSRFMPV